MRLNLQTEDFKRMIYNALLFADKKSDAKGSTLWQVWNDQLSVLTSDDFVLMTDSMEIPPVEEKKTFVFSYEDLKALSEQLKDATGQETQMRPAHWDEGRNQVLEDYLFVYSNSLIDEQKPPIDFAFWPDRLRKFTLIQPRGNPIEFAWKITPDEDRLLGFKIGNVHGLLAPIDMEDIGVKG